MRIKHSIKNIITGILSEVIIVALGFVSRKVFLDSLGIDYLGVNGLLTNVLSMLGLVESGIGISIVYNLYKPLSEDDKEKIIALVQLYKKAYAILAVIVFALSLALFPLLEILMRGSKPISYIIIIYFIFVLKNIISYLNAHKWSLINADQKGYVLKGIKLLFNIVTTIIRIIVLVLTKNYVLYLLIEVAVYILQNIINGRIVNKRYPYITTKGKYYIDVSTKDNITRNVKALFLHNLGGYCVFGTDNILISSFVNIATVGIYSNYTMIIQQLSALVTPILSGIEASVGNLIATENNNNNYSIFKVIYLVNFWLYSWCVISLYNLLEPFINWWLGSGYLLDKFTFIIILVNFYLTGLRTAIATFKNKAGLFIQDKYVPLIEALINLGTSIILVQYIGLKGIFIGTTISTISIVMWNQPRIVYKYYFKMPVFPYFLRYAFFAALTFTTCLLTTKISNIFFTGNSLLSLIGIGIICLIIPNTIYILIFYKTEEFQYLLNIIKMVITGVKAFFKKVFFDLINKVKLVIMKVSKIVIKL